MKHAFLAHPKSWEDLRVDSAIEVLDRMCAPLYPEGLTVTAGRDDYKSRALQLGGWRPWLNSVATGRRIDNSPRFDILILPPDDVGRATAEMVRAALGARRDVVQWDGGFAFVRGQTFRQVIWVEGSNWFANRVRLAERLKPQSTSTTSQEAG